MIQLSARAARYAVRSGRVAWDLLRASWVRLADRWPCLRPTYLIVGSESSGTTAIANLVFLGSRGLRFLEEGHHQWVWHAYQEIYAGRSTIRDFPQLQLFDAIKVPGFATILEPFREEFPNSKVVYCVRDPRDFINSAYRTWKIATVDELGGIPWCKENWLEIGESDPTARLAIRWKRYLALATAAGRVKFVRYEDFCADRVAVIREIADWFGITVDLDRVRRQGDKQLSHRSVRDYRPLGPGGWRSGPMSETQIRTIESICVDEMKAWGYSIE